MNFSDFISDLHDLLKAEIAAVYDGTDYLRPDPGDVIAEVLAGIRADARGEADHMANCGRVDDCTAQAIVLQRFADWLETAS